MKKESICCTFIRCTYEELPQEDKQLADAAKAACHTSYSPYSHFQVGCALRLDNDIILTGSNQENAAYPSGMCAERTVLYHAGAAYPQSAVAALAIAAHTADGFTNTPCPPCGACRQVMTETENRHGGHPMRIILYGVSECYIIEDGTQALLPLQFNDATLTSCTH